MPHVRRVKTATAAMVVQIVYSWHRGSREIEHIGSAHDDVELALLKAAAGQRLAAAGQGELDLGLDTGAAGGPLPITASRMGCLADALEHATGSWALTRPAAVMRCSLSWCWRGFETDEGDRFREGGSPRSGDWSRRSLSDC